MKELYSDDNDDLEEVVQRRNSRPSRTSSVQSGKTIYSCINSYLSIYNSIRPFPLIHLSINHCTYTCIHFPSFGHFICPSFIVTMSTFTYQISDSILNFPWRRASSAFHCTGNFLCPSTYTMQRYKVQSVSLSLCLSLSNLVFTIQILSKTKVTNLYNTICSLLDTRQLRAARSLWIKCCGSKYRWHWAISNAIWISFAKVNNAGPYKRNEWMDK